MKMALVGNRATWQIFNGLAPKDGPKGMPLITDFSVDAFIDVDLTLDEQYQTMEFVQSMYVDNASNAVALTFLFQITQQRLIVPANKTGMFPVLSPNPTKFRMSTTPGAGIAPTVILLNVPMPFFIW